MSFTVTTDTSCDIPRSELNSLGVPYIPLTYTVNGVTYPDEFSNDEEFRDFYRALKSGATPTTSQINSFLHEEFFTELFNKGHTEILHLSLSSGLSNTYNSAVIGAECAMEKNPGLTVRVVDTLSATLAHRALVDKALQLKKEELTLELAGDTLDAIKNNLQVWIFVDDLMHLKRGGRVSGAAAYVGTLLKIKPVLILDNLGKLTVVTKTNGWKKTLSYGVDMLFKHCSDKKNSTVYIASADADERIKEFIELIRARGFEGELKPGWIGPIIGSHTGAGTFGIVFFGDARLPNKS